MKSKKLNKKMVLRKETIANLEKEQLHAAKGGANVIDTSGRDNTYTTCCTSLDPANQCIDCHEW